jgi:hypothetical protein
MMRFGGAYEHMIVLDADSLMEDRDHRPARCQGHAKRKRQVIMVIHNAHHVVNADRHRDGPTPANLPPISYLSGGYTRFARQARPLKFSALKRIQRRERARAHFLLPATFLFADELPLPGVARSFITPTICLLDGFTMRILPS